VISLPSRIPPHNLDAERAVLGCCLLEGGRAVGRVAEILRPSDFYTDAHRVVFTTMLAMHERDVGVDLITLGEELRRAGQIEFVGGPAALALLVEQASIASHLVAYARTVRDHATLRETIQISTQLITEAYDAAGDPREVLTRAREQLDELEGRRVRQAEAPKAVGRILVELLDQFDRPENDFVTSPFAVVNERLSGGLLRSETLTLGGRPGVAKSAFVLQWARHAAGLGQKTLIISAEMKAIALGRRLLAQEARVAATTLRRRDLDAIQWRRLTSVMDDLVDLPLWIDDTTTTLAGIRRLLRGQDYRLVIVDYLQLVRSPEHRDRRLEVSAISSGLKRLAMQANCSVITLSSLTRLSTEKGKKVERPSMDKLKESGDIEADSDVVLLLHWPDTEQSERELIFAKVREGESGGVPLTLDFDPAFVRFVVPEPQLPMPDRTPGWVGD
jgi:replicative DNA helicase